MEIQIEILGIGLVIKMYMLILKRNDDTRHRLFYDPKKSTLMWHTGAHVDIPKEFINDEVKDFFQSVGHNRLLEELDNHEKFDLKCHHCPVLQICKGKHLKQSCDSEFIIYLSVLRTCIKICTGMDIELIKGYILRE